MQICIVTKDSVLARFIILELAEAGFSAEQCDTQSSTARLNIFDLDSFAEPPYDGSVGFSYNDSAAKRVQHFIQRPISVPALIKTVSGILTPQGAKQEERVLTLKKATRRIKTDIGEVRLSEKELALLLRLCKSHILSRDEAAEIFDGGKSNVVDVYIHYLRRKLRKICPYDIITSKRGEGYAQSSSVRIVIL